MKKVLTIVLAAVAFAAMLSFVAAGSSKRQQVTDADVLPAYEILTAMRSMALSPIGEPVRRGSYYVLHATDPSGIELRVVADAQFGNILSIAPARALNAGYVPRYQGGPRIIHVPQAGAGDERANNRASVNARDAPAASNDDDDEEAAAQPRRSVAPKPQRRSAAPPAPPQRRSAAPAPADPRRTVLSAPPPPAEGPTPIRPTPRYNSMAEPAGKFGPPRDVTSSAPPPPPGYTPPAALPPSD